MCGLTALQTAIGLLSKPGADFPLNRDQTFIQTAIRLLQIATRLLFKPRLDCLSKPWSDCSPTAIGLLILTDYSPNRIGLPSTPRSDCPPDRDQTALRIEIMHLRILPSVCLHWQYSTHSEPDDELSVVSLVWVNISRLLTLLWSWRTPKDHANWWD